MSGVDGVVSLLESVGGEITGSADGSTAKGSEFIALIKEILVQLSRGSPRKQ